jgi:hypothetical protein
MKVFRQPGRPQTMVICSGIKKPSTSQVQSSFGVISAKPISSISRFGLALLAVNGAAALSQSRRSSRPS